MRILRNSSRKSLVGKILLVTHCSSRIFSGFLAKTMIPIDPGGGGVPRFSFREPAIFFAALAAALLFSTGPACAQAQRGTLVHEETIRVSPSTDAAKLGEASRGHELVIIETSRDWTHVEAILREPRKEADEADPESEGKTITGWVSSKALVNLTTPDGDKIVFGEAADSEDQASRRRGRRDAAQDAMRLYYRVYDLLPASPLAAEALYRASYMRGQMQEEWMKLVIKKYPGTKWADLAAFRLIENRLCGEWEGLAKCPEKEADLYENYAKEHPQSPAAAEALYNAAWRRSALIEIYRAEPNQKKAAESRDRALALAQKVVSQYGQSDWALRTERLIFYIQQGIPTYGNTAD